MIRLSNLLNESKEMKLYLKMLKQLEVVNKKKEEARDKYGNPNNSENQTKKYLRDLQKWHTKQNELNDKISLYHQVLFQRGELKK